MKLWINAFARLVVAAAVLLTAGVAMAHPRHVVPLDANDLKRIEAQIRYEIEGKWGALFNDYIVGVRTSNSVCVCGVVEVRAVGSVEYVARLNGSGVDVVAVADAVAVRDYCIRYDILLH